MDSDPVVRNLLFLYAGSVLCNVAISATLYARDRNPLYRMLLLAWGALFVSFAAQGALSHGDLLIVLGFSTSFAVNLAFARLLAASDGRALPWPRYVLALVGGLLLTVAAWAMGASFLFIALPTALTVSLPCLVVSWQLLRGRRRLGTPTAILMAGCLMFSLHNIDFAFLRDKPELAPLGFTLAMLVVFALSIAGPAVALERATQDKVRLATELDVAHRIQDRLAPQDQLLPGLEVACYMRSADSVGGDYLDMYRDGDRCWFLLGDVTGHGLGAALVMLMAQSTMSSLLHARPEISPRQLNFLANRVLAQNLQRMGERRHLSAVSVLRLADNRFVVSGSHDGLFVYRAASRKVELHPLNHFPIGLGYLGELEEEAFREELLELADGDLLLLFTDGITEAAPRGDPSLGLFGTEEVGRLLVAQAEAPLADLKSKLLTALERYTGGAYHDDVAFLVMRTRAVPSAKEVA